MQRWWRLPRWDLALAVVLTAWNQWELTRAEFTDGAVALNHVTFAVMTMSVALRRAAPLACATVTALGLTVQTIWGGDVFGAAAQFVAQLVATHAAGAHPDRRRAWIGLAVMFVAVESYPFVSGEPVVLADEVGNIAVFVTVWWLARAVRSGEDEQVRLAQEHAAREREVVEHERARVARELHDIVAHGLSVMVLHSSAARAATTDLNDDVQRSLGVVEDAGRQAMTELHRLLGMLVPTDEEPTHLASLGDLDDLCQRMRASGMDIVLQVGELGAVDRSVGQSAYRVVQEALTNALRHAHGSGVRVAVEQRANELEIVVEDSGATGRKPTVPPAGAGTGFGLQSMRERVELFGGSFEVGPTPDGWRVRAVLPARSSAVV